VILGEIDVQSAFHILGADRHDRVSRGIAAAGTDHRLGLEALILHLAEEQHGVVLVGGLQHHIHAGALEAQDDRGESTDLAE